MLNRAPVELRVGGQTYKVASTATEDELRRLARVVEEKMRELGPTASFHPQSMLLVAIALAHELEEERSRRRRAEHDLEEETAKRQRVEQRSRNALETLLARVDAALELTEGAVESGDSAPNPQ